MEDEWEAYQTAVECFENNIPYAAQHVFIDLVLDTSVSLHIRASAHQFLAKLNMHDYAVSRHNLIWSIWVCEMMAESGQYIQEQVADIQANAVSVYASQDRRIY